MSLGRAMSLRILSGGQTGVDRAALAWAIRNRVPHGGWCPRGRRSENGPIPARYRLQETPSAAVGERTLWNVRDSDGTAILCTIERLRGGTAQTARFCLELEKPVAIFASSVWTPQEAGLLLARFLHRHRIRNLNVAGPRASEDAGAVEFARRVLDAMLRIRGRG